MNKKKFNLEVIYVVGELELADLQDIASRGTIIEEEFFLKQTPDARVLSEMVGWVYERLPEVGEAIVVRRVREDAFSFYRLTRTE